ncbi:Uncharacterised protein, partial [Mycoplasmopsis edwardii]
MLIVLISLIFILFISFLAMFIVLENDKRISALVALGILIILISGMMLGFYALLEFSRSRDLIKKSFNGFIEEIMTKNNIGVCIFDTKQQIVW